MKKIFNPKYIPAPTQTPEMPASYDKWDNDLLGEGFKAITLELLPDEEGENCATLVKYVPQEDPNFIPGTPEKPWFSFLFIHGWNDYYFQRELARHVALAGGAFYAIDLAKYGRSLRDWQTLGWTGNIEGYDEDIAAAWEMIDQEHAGLPRVLSGHSTGGLTAAYWASRHREALQGLFLNSPWIEMPKGHKQRKALLGVGSLVALNEAKQALPFQSADTSYVDSLSGWDDEIHGNRPHGLKGWEHDPSLSGWHLIREWKGSHRAILRFGWFKGIAKAQGNLLKAKPTQVPTFFATSTSTYYGSDPRQMMFADTVLSVETMCSNAWRLSTNVQIHRYPGKHDLFLSFPPVRQKLWSDFHAWTNQYFPCPYGTPTLAQSSIEAICP